MIPPSQAQTGTGMHHRPRPNYHGDPAPPAVASVIRFAAQDARGDDTHTRKASNYTWGRLTKEVLQP
ncbi:hypothetical protein GCM10010358_69170 [Streptomyces minutiscleroticus]|uniref:Uncharacterized protein n=1 Tax=Streptomyces minutiscleroticus TaxID=68238 RepID=A0A918NYI7_9ACTN|nr:hypothetical protein GCM10010358_69170 [Streptomyces minutiscleroticus]